MSNIMMTNNYKSHSVLPDINNENKHLIENEKINSQIEEIYDFKKAHLEVKIIE